MNEIYRSPIVGVRATLFNVASGMLKMTRSYPALLALFALLIAYADKASAEIFGGIDFPQGASSFADEVLRYDPLFGGGPAPTDPTTMNPGAALQAPQGGDPEFNSVSLGDGGLLELAFLNNLLTNSGDADFDLHIFEVGNIVEATFVAIRPTPATKILLDNAFGPIFDSLNPNPALNGDGFFDIGIAGGATTSIDIDAFFPGFAASLLQFNAVQLIDVPFPPSTNNKNGAEIDAVGAIASAEVRIPEATSMFVWCVSVVFGLGTRFTRRRRRTRT